MACGMRTSTPPSTSPRLPLLALAAVSACNEGERPAPTTGPDGTAALGPARRDERDRPPVARALEAGAALLQDTTPVDQLQLVFGGFHGIKREVGRPPEAQRQFRAFHYCDRLNMDFYQCAVFDGDDVGAHLIAIEYVVSAPLYATLPVEEKQYWHPHAGEVDSGLMTAPGLLQPNEEQLLLEMRATYGKIWQLWDTRADILPFGEPTLAWTIPSGKINQSTRAAMQAGPRLQ